MECRCAQIVELNGNDAQQYARAHLCKERVDSSGWLTEFVCPESGKRWLMDYPHSERHGGGPAQLRSLTDTAAAEIFGTESLK